MTTAEQQYFATELEFSCIVWVVRKVRHYIEAAPEDLVPIFYTDHLATINLATSLTTSSAERLNLRLVRGSQYLQQFRLRVCHRSGASNHVADALSRLPTENLVLPRHDDDLDALFSKVLKSFSLRFIICREGWDGQKLAYSRRGIRRGKTHDHGKKLSGAPLSYMRAGKRGAVRNCPSRGSPLPTLSNYV